MILKKDNSGFSGASLPFGWSETEGSIPARFAGVVKKFGPKPAIKSAGSVLTYEMLDLESERIAHSIRARFQGAGRPVVIFLEEGAMSIAALLGVLKTGNFYVVLDPSLPTKALSGIADDIQSDLIVTNQKYYGRAAGIAGRKALINIDRLGKNPPREKLSSEIPPDSIATVFYTSGSTGRPKGVLHNHRNILHYVWNKTRDYDIVSEDRSSHLYSSRFIASLPDVFSTLLNGATLYPFSVRESGIDGLIRWLATEGITIFHPPVGLYRQLFPHLTEEGKFESVRLVLLSGQQIRRDDLMSFRRWFPADCVLWHTLGSTEAGVLSKLRIDGTSEVKDGVVPVGYADTEKEIFLLDGNGEKTGPVRTGEIAVRSRYLSQGYWRRPDLTARKFLPDPEGKNKRIFLTGDLGRIGRDGRLELAGRRDFQEKIRGYRVDLTEIETVLASHARIKEAVVAAREKEDGEKYLLAYIVCAGSPPPTAGELRRFLLESLPEYMVPSDFITLTELPLTPTGKVDRKRLPAPEHTRPEMDDALISPRNALELRLAKMWEKLLNMRPVGIKDNFFELGGHSILAMRMVSRIEKLTGRTMPVTVLFEAPTVETLAELLVKDGWSPSRICLIPVQPGGSKPPLFYIPPAGMTVIGAADLSRYLGEDQPLYGLQPRGISGRKIEPHRSVEEMASCYIEEIRQVQPEGPYYLAGRCFGGVVAFEMAQQLLAQGQRTAFLGMIDTVFPPGYFRDFGQKKKERAAKPNGRETGSLRRYAGRLLYYLSERPRHLPRALYRKIKTVLKRAFRRTAAQTRKTCRKIYFYASRISLNPGKRRVYRVEVAQYHAKRAYAPSVYPGRITCFWPSEAEQRIARKRIGWQKLSTEMIESHVIPGDHYTMTFEPNVGVLAAALKKCLADAAVESRRRRDENG